MGRISLIAATLPFDYGIYGIGFAVIFYFFHIEPYDWNKFFAAFIILHVFLTAQNLSLGIMQIFAIPSILGLGLLKKYDDKIRINKKFFYSFYPLHMLCFILIKAYII